MDFANYLMHSFLTDNDHAGQTLLANQSTTSNTDTTLKDTDNPAPNDTESQNIVNISNETLPMSVNYLSNSASIVNARNAQPSLSSQLVGSVDNDVATVELIRKSSDNEALQPSLSSQLVGSADKDVATVELISKSLDNEALQLSSYSPTVAAIDKLASRDIVNETVSHVTDNIIKRDLSEQALPASASNQEYKETKNENVRNNETRVCKDIKSVQVETLLKPENLPNFMIIEGARNDLLPRDESSDVSVSSESLSFSRQLIRSILDDTYTSKPTEVSSSLETEQFQFSRCSQTVTSIDCSVPNLNAKVSFSQINADSSKSDLKSFDKNSKIVNESYPVFDKKSSNTIEDVRDDKLKTERTRIDKSSKILSESLPVYDDKSPNSIEDKLDDELEAESTRSAKCSKIHNETLPVLVLSEKLDNTIEDLHEDVQERALESQIFNIDKSPKIVKETSLELSNELQNTINDVTVVVSTHNGQRRDMPSESLSELIHSVVDNTSTIERNDVLTSSVTKELTLPGYLPTTSPISNECSNDSFSSTTDTGFNVKNIDETQSSTAGSSEIRFKSGTEIPIELESPKNDDISNASFLLPGDLACTVQDVQSGAIPNIEDVKTGAIQNIEEVQNDSISNIEGAQKDVIPKFVNVRNEAIVPMSGDLACIVQDVQSGAIPNIEDVQTDAIQNVEEMQKDSISNIQEAQKDAIPRFVNIRNEAIVPNAPDVGLTVSTDCTNSTSLPSRDINLIESHTEGALSLTDINNIFNELESVTLSNESESPKIDYIPKAAFRLSGDLQNIEGVQNDKKLPTVADITLPLASKCTNERFSDVSSNVNQVEKSPLATDCNNLFNENDSTSGLSNDPKSMQCITTKNIDDTQKDAISNIENVRSDAISNTEGVQNEYISKIEKVQNDPTENMKKMQMDAIVNIECTQKNLEPNVEYVPNNPILNFERVQNNVIPNVEKVQNDEIKITEGTQKDAVLNTENEGNDAISIDEVTPVHTTSLSQKICFTYEDFVVIDCEDALSVSSTNEHESDSPQFEAYVCSECDDWFCHREELMNHAQVTHEFFCGICDRLHPTRDGAKGCFMQHLRKTKHSSIIIKGSGTKPQWSNTEDNQIGQVSLVPFRYVCPICVDNGKSRPSSSSQASELKRHVRKVHGASLPDLSSKTTNYDPLTTRVLIAGTTKNYRLKRNSIVKNNADKSKTSINRDHLLSLIKASKVPESSVTCNTDIDKHVKVNKSAMGGCDKEPKTKSARVGSDENTKNIKDEASKSKHSLKNANKQNTRLSNSRSKLFNLRIMSTKLRLRRTIPIKKLDKKNKKIVERAVEKSSKDEVATSLESPQRYACPVCIDIGQPLQINTKKMSVLRKHALNRHYVILPDLKKNADFDPLTTRVLMANSGEEYQRTSRDSVRGVDTAKHNSCFEKYLLSPNKKVKAENSLLAEKSFLKEIKESKVEQLRGDDKDSKLLRPTSRRSGRFDKSIEASNEVSLFGDTGNDPQLNRIAENKNYKDRFVASAVSLLKDTLRSATMDKPLTGRDLHGTKKQIPQSEDTRYTFGGKESRKELHNLKRKSAFDETPGYDTSRSEGRRGERASKRHKRESNATPNCEVAVFRNLDREIGRSMEIERSGLNELNDSVVEIESCGYSDLLNESVASNRSRRNNRETSVRIITRDHNTEKVMHARMDKNGEQCIKSKRESGMNLRTGRNRIINSEKNDERKRDFDYLNQTKNRETFEGSKVDWGKDRVKSWVNDRNTQMEGLNQEGGWKGSERKEKYSTRASLMSPLRIEVSATESSKHRFNYKPASSSRIQQSPAPHSSSNGAAQSQSQSNARREERGLRDRLSRSLSCRSGPWIAGEVYRDVLIEFPVEESVVVGRELMEVGQRYSEASEYIFNEAERRIGAGQDPVQAYRDVTGELLSGFY